MQRPEINFIQDPSIARAIDDLKRRWPAIGAAADHPLTEFFIQRDARKERRRRAIDPKYWRFIIVICIFGFFFSMRFSPTAMHFYMRYNPLIMVLVFLGVALNRKYRKPPKRNDLRSPFHMLAEAGDVSQWAHLWLAPLSYRDVAGTCIGVFYHARVTKKLWLWRLITALVITAAALLFFENAASVIDLWDDQYLLPGVAVGSSSIFFIFALRSLLRNPAYIVHRAMKRIQLMVIQRQKRFFVAHKFWRRGCATFLLVIGFEMNSFLIIILRHWIWMTLSLSIVMWGLIILAISRRLSKMDMSRRFEEFVARETPEFEQLVCQMLDR